MPLNAGPNISAGYGLGLQAITSNEGVNIANSALDHLAEQRKQKAGKEAALKAKKDLLTEKEFERITPYDTHQTGQEDAKAYVNAALDKALTIMKSGDNDAESKVAQIVEGVKQKAFDAKNEKDRLSAVQKDINDSFVQGTASPYLLAANDALNTTNKEALKKLGSSGVDPTRQIIIDPGSGNVGYYPAPKINTLQTENQLMNKALSSVQQFENYSYVDPKGGIQKYDVSSMPETRTQSLAIQKQFNLPSPPPSVEDATAFALNDPQYRRRKEIDYINSGLLPEDYYNKPKAERDKLIQGYIKNDLELNSRVKIARETREPNAPEKGIVNTKTLEENAGQARTFEVRNKKRGEDEVQTYGGGALDKPINTTVKFSKGAFNGDNFTKVPEGEADVKLSLPEIYLVNKKTGEILGKKGVELAQKSSQYDSNNLEWRVYASGDAKFKTPAKGGAEKTGSERVIFPIEDAKGAYETDKQKIKIQPYIDEAKRLNSEIPKGKESNVHSASRDQWKAAGWTDKQIDDAVKQGKIEVK